MPWIWGDLSYCWSQLIVHSKSNGSSIQGEGKETRDAILACALRAEMRHHEGSLCVGVYRIHLMSFLIAYIILHIAKMQDQLVAKKKRRTRNTLNIVKILQIHVRSTCLSLNFLTTQWCEYRKACDEQLFSENTSSPEKWLLWAVVRWAWRQPQRQQARWAWDIPTVQLFYILPDKVWLLFVSEKLLNGAC